MGSQSDESGGAPLAGITVVELAAEGPVPFAAKQLADLGASVLRIAAPFAGHDTLGIAPQFQFLLRDRRVQTLDLKRREDRETFHAIIADADVLLEGYRPGVATRLGVDPAACWAVNRRLIHAHVSGYGDSGPMASLPGHDINFIALSGLLSTLGRADGPPPPPQGLLADFGGGGTFLVIGVLAALLERQRTGRGSSFSVSMMAASAMLMAETYGLHAAGAWGSREENLFDGGAPFYDCYETSDARYMAVGALEPAFFANLMNGLGLDRQRFTQYDRSCWPELRNAISSRFASDTRDRWSAVFGSLHACVTPVLDLDEAPLHPQATANAIFDGERGCYGPTQPIRPLRSAPAGS